MTMTPERAQYVYSRCRLGSLPMAFRRRDTDTNSIDPDGITREEDASIRALWRTMPGSTCYADALLRIARGAVPPAATRVWYCEATIAQWNAMAGDFDEIVLDHYSRADSPEAAEYDAREAWGEHGNVPEKVTVRAWE
jgi:hypothetical protein